MTTEREVKQVIVIRRDLHMRRGKEIAQGAHASMIWLGERIRNTGKYGAQNTDDTWVPIRLTPAEMNWLSGPFTKITVQVPDNEALVNVFRMARDVGLTVHRVIDAGRTEFHGEPTVTAIAIGPDWADEIDKVTGELALY